MTILAMGLLHLLYSSTLALYWTGDLSGANSRLPELHHVFVFVFFAITLNLKRCY